MALRLGRITILAGMCSISQNRWRLPHKIDTHSHSLLGSAALSIFYTTHPALLQNLTERQAGISFTTGLCMANYCCIR